MPTSLGSRVRFFFDRAAVDIRNRTGLKVFIESIFRIEDRELKSINYIFCRDKKLREINKEFLGHDFFTDIITFTYSDESQPVVSDVYISVDRVKENAVSHGTTLKEELHRVIFHGALHLCGYRDKTLPQKKQMRGREDYYLSRYR